jgi:hypothetical protein
MTCPECGHGAGWCKYCGEDTYRSQRRMRLLYLAIILLVLGLLGYFFLDIGISPIG